MRVQLTDRDRDLFRMVDSYGVMSTNQIRRLIFANIDRSVVLRRLRILRHKKFLVATPGLPQGELAWTLAFKARQLIHSDFEISLNKNQLEHDILLSEIRLRLERGKVCHSWITGFHLKQLSSQSQPSSYGYTSQIPDAIFSVQMPYGVRVVALELEATSKTKRRYREIIQNYRINTKVNWVWYVVTEKSLSRFLCDTANSFPREDSKKWLYTSNLKDVLNPKSPVVLSNCNHSVIFLKGD